MKAAVYPRVSTDEQFKEGYSIDSQKENCVNFIKSQGWDLHEIYVEEGASAKDLNRPSMNRLIKDAKENKFDVVVFYKLDRLVRSVSDLDTLLKLFDAHKIAIRSVTEPFDTTTAIGRFLITLVAAIAQWERETISERVILNMTKKAHKGERNGGRVPFGYRLVDGSLEIDPKESTLVEEIFRLYVSGYGFRSISIYLQQFGVYKGIRTISRMIDNPVYIGKLRWGNNSQMDTIITEEKTHPPIIEEDLFSQAQKMRKQRTMEGKKATSPYHFSGVLKCARCGSPLSGYFKKERGSKHYICIAKKNKGTCDLPMFTEKALTQEFLNNLSPDDPERFFKITNNFNIETPKQKDRTYLVEDLEKELTAIKNRKKNWLMALGNGVISQEEYLSLSGEDTKKEQLIREELDQFAQDEIKLDKDAVLEILKSIPIMWPQTNDFEKKSFVYELFDTISVDVPKDYIRAPGRTPSVMIKEFKLRQ